MKKKGGSSSGNWGNFIFEHRKRRGKKARIEQQKMRLFPEVFILIITLLFGIDYNLRGLCARIAVIFFLRVFFF